MFPARSAEVVVMVMGRAWAGLALTGPANRTRQGATHACSRATSASEHLGRACALAPACSGWLDVFGGGDVCSQPARGVGTGARDRNKGEAESVAVHVEPPSRVGWQPAGEPSPSPAAAACTTYPDTDVPVSVSISVSVSVSVCPRWRGKRDTERAFRHGCFCRPRPLPARSARGAGSRS